MLSKLFFLVLCVVSITCDSLRVKRTKYYSYPSRFYKLPPLPHLIKGPFSITPPPGYMNDDDPPYRHNKVSRKPSNDGLGEDDINNLVKHLTKKDFDRIVEYANETRYADKYVNRFKDGSSERLGYERPSIKRPETFIGLNSDEEKFLFNGPFVKEEDTYKLKYNNEQSYVKPAQITYSDYDINPNLNYVNDASQTEVKYSVPPESFHSKVYRNPDGFNQPEITKAKILNTQGNSLPNNIMSTNANNMGYNNHQVTYQEAPIQSHNNQYSNSNHIMYSNHQAAIPSNQVIYSSAQEIPYQNSNQNALYRNIGQNQNNPYTNANLETEESKRHYVTYVTVPPPNIEAAIYTSSETMKEEHLPKPLNLREDDYEPSNTDNVPRVVKSDSYDVQSFKELPLMNEYQNSKLHTVSSYNVPHYTVTHTKSQPQPPSYSAPSTPIKVPEIEKAPPGYTGKEMSDAHLKAVKIWTHRSQGTAYTLHDDGTLSLEKPKIQTSYGYA